MDAGSRDSQVIGENLKSIENIFPLPYGCTKRVTQDAEREGQISVLHLDNTGSNNKAHHTEGVVSVHLPKKAIPSVIFVVLSSLLLHGVI